MSNRPSSAQSRTAWDDGYGDGIRTDPDLGMDSEVILEKTSKLISNIFCSTIYFFRINFDIFLPFISEMERMAMYISNKVILRSILRISYRNILCEVIIKLLSH